MFRFLKIPSQNIAQQDFLLLDGSEEGVIVRCCFGFYSQQRVVLPLVKIPLLFTDSHPGDAATYPWKYLPYGEIPQGEEDRQVVRKK